MANDDESSSTLVLLNLNEVGATYQNNENEGEVEIGMFSEACSVFGDGSVWF